MTSMLRKGQTLDDGTYVYKCGCVYGNPDCPYCYAGDLDKCLAAIKTARGEVYYGLLKTILSHIGKSMVDEAKAIGKSRGKFTVIDIGRVCLKFGLNFKATCEWLEETNAIRSGTYDTIKDNRIKVSDILAKAAEPLMEDAQP